MAEDAAPIFINNGQMARDKTINIVITEIRSLEAKVDKMRPKTAQEKLELRSLDSGPFKQKLSDFFQDKMEDMEKTGKEYVLTADDVENYTPRDIGDSFDEYLPKATDFTK